MKVNCKFWFEDDNGKKFFGKGNYLLLKEINKTKSLNKASKNLKMSLLNSLKCDILKR